MTKSELKTGMIVRTCESSRNLYVVILSDYSCLMNYDGFLDLKRYSEDLCSTVNEKFTIKEVYKMGSILNLYLVIQKILSNKFDAFTENKLSLIWRRQETTEMTIAEIEKALGVTNLKIIGE